MVNKKDYGFGGANAEVKPEQPISVPKDKMTLRPDMSIDNTGRIKGENPVGVSPETMPFGSFTRASTNAEEASYNTTDPASRAKRPTWGENIPPGMKK